MKNTKHHDAVLAWITANPNMTFDSIKEGNPKVSHIMLKSVIKDLQEEGIIASNDEDGGYVITGTTKKVDVQPKKEAKENKQVVSTVGAKAVDPVEKKKKEEEDEELGPKTLSGRDFSKYSFNGVSGLSKGRVALAIIKHYVKENPKTTLAKMEELFQSKIIQKRYGIFEELSKAKKHTVNGRERYFFKEADVIKVANQKMVVTSQWSIDNLTQLLSIAKKEVGYKITATVAK